MSVVTDYNTALYGPSRPVQRAGRLAIGGQRRPACSVLHRRAQSFLTGSLGALLIGWGSFISTPEASRCPPRRPDGIRRPPPGPSGAVPVVPSHPGQSVSSVNRGELSQPPTAQSELSPKQPAQWAIECAGTDITLSYREPKEPCGSWSAPRDKLH